MYKLLIVDDEERIRTLIKKYALLEGHSVSEACNGLEAVRFCQSESFDIIIMDIMMPELDGFSAVKALREFSQAPVIMLSARGEEYDKLHGFELGVDDYVVKPFSPRELMMRIDAIMKRSGKKEGKHKIYHKDGLKIDFTARKVYVEEDEINLTPKEYDLLFYMAENRNIALSREKLISAVWGYDYFGDDRTLDTHIKMLRKSLKSASGVIITLRGVGYRFEG